MEPASPPPPPDNDEVVVRGTQHLPWLVGVLVPVIVIVISFQLSPLFAVVVATVFVGAGAVLVQRGAIGALGFGWYPAELVVPPGPLFLGSRTEIDYRRRPRRPWPGGSGTGPGPGLLQVALVCEERVRINSGQSSSVRTATVVRHLFAVPLTASPTGLAATFTIEIPLVAGAPTMSIGPDKSVGWRIEATLNGPRLPRDQIRFVLMVTPVISPAWFDQRTQA